MTGNLLLLECSISCKLIALYRNAIAIVCEVIGLELELRKCLTAAFR
jgi:hypothetical protein